MKKKIKSGFSLIELLITIAITSIILVIASISIINIINNSKEKSDNLSISNIEKIANTYILEYAKDIIWEKEKENPNNTYTCISIQELINKNYLDQETSQKYLEYENIIITKDNNQNIITEQLDTKKICSNLDKKVAIPKEKDYCNQVVYNTQEQTLTKTPEHNKFIFQNNKGTNAGYYTVTAKLQANYIWEDSTTENKTITCIIDKKTPTLTLSPNGSDSSNIETLTTILNSNTSGNISIKSSNPTYATASTTNNNITKNEDKIITIKTLASRSTTTYLTFTLTPNDLNNYYTSSVIYTIGNINKKKVDIPTSEKYCKTLTYNGNQQTLTNKPNEGYNFINITGTNAGIYTITAKLKYGYYWNTTKDPYNDITFNCQINKKIPNIIINPTNGEIRKNKTTTLEVKSLDTTGNISITNDNNYVSINNISSNIISPNITSTITLQGLNKVDQTTILVTFTPNDTNNYETNIQKYYTLKVLPNEVKVNYDTNGGTSCSPTYKTVIMEETYGTLCTTSKDGYNFDGWYLSNGNLITNNSTVTLETEHTIFANWTPKQYQISLDNQNATQKGTTSVTATYTKDLPKITTPIRQYTVTFNYNGNGTPTNSNTASYTFNGYFTEKNSLGTKYYTTDGTGTKKWDLTYDTTLYTGWNSTSITLPNPSKEGYTFLGWYDANGTKIGNGNDSYTPTSNITLTASWQINKYYFDLNWEIDDNKYGSGSKYGTGSQIYACMKINGIDQGCIPDYYQQLEYGTTWEIYGLKLDEYEITNYNKTGKIPNKDSSHTPTLYTISIKSNNNNYGSVTELSIIVPKETTYKTNTNQLTFETGTSDINIKANTKTQKGYTTTFSEWSSTSGTISTKTTITANFNRTTHTYKITYNGNGNTSGSTQDSTHTYDVSSTLTANGFAKTGYSFTGWATTLNGNTIYTDKQEILNLTDINNDTITLYAVWTPKVFTITLNNQGATQAGTTAVYEKYATGIYLNSTLTKRMTTTENKITLPRKSGYNFLGYFTETKNGTKMINENGYKTSSFTNKDYTKNATLYAHWENKLTLAKHSTNGSWYVYDRPGYIINMSEASITNHKKNVTHKSTDKPNTNYLTARGYVLGTKTGNVYGYFDDEGNILKDNDDYYRNYNNKEFIKIYISETNFKQDSYSKKKLTELTDKITKNNTTYYGVWIAVTCEQDGITCPENGVSIIVDN